MGRIDDDTAGDERNAMLGGDLRGDVRFHIDGSRARLIMEVKLFHRACDYGIRAGDVRVDGVRQRLEEPLCPCAIGREYALAVLTPDATTQSPATRSGANPPAMPKLMIPEAPRAIAAPERPQAPNLIANDRNPRTARDAGLKL